VRLAASSFVLGFSQRHEEEEEAFLFSHNFFLAALAEPSENSFLRPLGGLSKQVLVKAARFFFPQAVT